MNDLEDRLRKVMLASVADAVPAFTIADVKRGHHRRRVRMTAVGILTATAVVLAAIFVPWPRLAPLFGTGPGSPAAAPGRFVDPAYGWSIRYPRGVFVGHFRDQGRFVADGVRVTTFAPDLGAPNTGLEAGVPNMRWLRDFPADGVAVQIWSLEGPPGMPSLHDSTFPLDRSSFQQFGLYTGGRQTLPFYRSFQGDGFSFTAALWFGSRASDNNKSAAWAVVRSLRFPALRTGTIWHHTFYVVGVASRYPIGSITAFPASALPRGSFGRRGGFWLLRYRRGFYVIEDGFPNPANHYRSCSVTFDARTHRFACPGAGLRWDRNGLPIGPHAPSGLDSALPLHFATVSQDGHVLFSPFFGPAPRPDLPRVRQ
jgi:hypothetical protein